MARVNDSANKKSGVVGADPYHSECLHLTWLKGNRQLVGPVIHMLSHILCHSSCCRTVNIAQHLKNVDLHLTDFHKGRNYPLEPCENEVQCHLWTESQCLLVSVCYKQRSPRALSVVWHNYIRMILGSARHFVSAGTVQTHCNDSECRSGNIKYIYRDCNIYIK